MWYNDTRVSFLPNNNMKKHYLVATVGTLALVANLLIPELAFGQTQQAQQGTQQINCPNPGDVSITSAPDSVTFNPTTSPTSGTASTYDPNLPTQSTHRSIHEYYSPDLPNQMLVVTDNISKGIYGCQGKAWYVTAKISSYAAGTYGLVKGTDVIPASSMILALPDYYTLDDAAIESFNTCTTVQSLPAYGMWACDFGDTGRHAFTALGLPLVPASTSYNYQTSGPFDDATPGPKTLDGDVYLMRHACGDNPALGEENSMFFVGAALYIKDGIAQYQPRGTYTGTITYTLDPGATCT